MTIKDKRKKYKLEWNFPDANKETFVYADNKDNVMIGHYKEMLYKFLHSLERTKITRVKE